MHCLFDSRPQLIYRIAHGLVEIVQPFSIHSSVKGSTDISTGQPELDVILFVDHRVLTDRESGTSQRSREGGHTRIMVRSMLTEPKTAVAGVILEISFARFSPSMATLREERIPSRPFGR